MLDELRKLGFSESRNLTVEYRSVEQEREAVFAAAAELVRSNTDVIVAVGPEVGLQAAVAATSTIPIVIAAFNYDPIARGYVKSLAQPGGNITGVFLRLPELAAKQVELLTQTFPDRTRLAMLWDELSSDQFSAAENRAKLLGLQVLSTKLERPPYDFDAAFRSMIESSPQMLLILSSPRFIAQRQRIANLAIAPPPARHEHLQILCRGRCADVLRRGYRTCRSAEPAITLPRYLRGAKPADLPVEQVTNFETGDQSQNREGDRHRVADIAFSLRADEVIE